MLADADAVSCTHSASGPYCKHCIDANGKLQSFENRLENMIAFTIGREPNLEREEAERRVRAYLATMPAWKDHPGLRGDS